MSASNKAHALKNSYVDGIIDELGGASDPAVRMAARGQDVASGHFFLDEGKQGVINDGDPNLYYHRGGNTHRFENPGLSNPLPGGAGERRLDNMEPADIPDLRQKFDNHQKRLEDQKYGTGNLA